MSFRKTVARSAVVGAIGFSALGLGVGLGTASADPWQPCWAQTCQGDQRGDGRADQWRPDQGSWDQRPWDQRGIDDARGDHQPFNWQGQRVEPYFDNDRGAWGFWFLGLWIPL